MSPPAEPTPTPRLYDDLAYLWPLLSPPEDYAEEAATILSLALEHLPAERFAAGHRPTLLELGAGGGHTLVHLANRFDCTAVDLSEPMLANCRSLVPSAETLRGDMRTLRLDASFDLVLVHDAIDYMATEADTRAAVATAAAHVRPGGLAIIAPTYLADDFEDGDHESDHRADGDLRLTYLGYARRSPSREHGLDLHLVYVIDRGGEVEVVHDAHRCGLFPRDRWTHWLGASGLTVIGELDADGPWYGFVARRPSPEAP